MAEYRPPVMFALRLPARFEFWACGNSAINFCETGSNMLWGMMFPWNGFAYPRPVAVVDRVVGLKISLANTGLPSGSVVMGVVWMPLAAQRLHVPLGEMAPKLPLKYAGAGTVSVNPYCVVSRNCS